MGRRDAGSGSVFQRGDGYWVSQYDGRTKYSKTKQDARKKLTQMLKASDDVKPSNITVQTALDQYMKASAPNLKARSLVKYQSVIDNHLSPNLGTTKLHALTALEIESLYTAMISNGSSPSTVRVVHAVLSSSLKGCALKVL